MVINANSLYSRVSLVISDDLPREFASIMEAFLIPIF